MAAIVSGSVVKGIATGLAAGVVARWPRPDSRIISGRSCYRECSSASSSAMPRNATARHGLPGMPPISTLVVAVLMASNVSAQAPAPDTILVVVFFGTLGRRRGRTARQRRRDARICLGAAIENHLREASRHLPASACQSQG